ncbi:PREDICTED: ATPase SWSAP1 [Elephantulus edwardii]|uniref:ATPase SWSAP1 n=1 Tax=Elephantulus edwardii TaxID=28737 RepID=UPI0003F0A3B2|nr:PREDICTED: ATPase SWSAP1 [Elephantulus edwardii]
MAELLRRMLSAGRASRPSEENTVAAGPPLLLLGGSGSGKTALLFAAALEVAGEGRGPVLFLARRPLQSLPFRTGAALDPLRLQKIHFKYPPSARELFRFLCSAHEAQGPAPALLLLDCLEEYLSEHQRPHEVAHLAALLLDTTAHFSHRAGPRGGCGLVVALQTQEDVDSGDTRQLALLQRYFSASCWLQLDAQGPRHRGLRVCLEPGELGPRTVCSVTFQPDGSLTVTSLSTEEGDPSSGEGTSSGVGQPPKASVSRF